MNPSLLQLWEKTETRTSKFTIEQLRNFIDIPDGSFIFDIASEGDTTTTVIERRISERVMNISNVSNGTSSNVNSDNTNSRQTTVPFCDNDDSRDESLESLYELCKNKVVKKRKLLNGTALDTKTDSSAPRYRLEDRAIIEQNIDEFVYNGDENGDETVNDTEAVHESEETVNKLYFNTVILKIKTTDDTLNLLAKDDKIRCAIRVPFELTDETQLGIGALGMVRYITNNVDMIRMVSLPPIQKDYNNLTKVVSAIATVLHENIGTQCSFCPDVSGHNGRVKPGSLYMTEHVMYQYARPHRKVLDVHWLGRVSTLDEDNETERKFHLFINNAIDLKRRSQIDLMEKGIHFDINRLDATTEELLHSYPKLVDQQLATPIDEAQSSLLLQHLGIDGLCVVIAINAAQNISANNIDLFKSYGGCIPTFLLYGPPNGGKSTLLSVAQGVYGINEFSESHRGESVLKISDFTTAALDGHLKAFRSFVVTLEDCDREGNKQASGGVRTVIWHGADYAKKITVCRGVQNAPKVMKLLTMNSPPPFKDEGTRSRTILLLHDITKILADLKQSELSKCAKDLSAIIPHIQRRGQEILTRRLSRTRLRAAENIMDRIATDIETDHPRLYAVMNSRNIQQLVPILALSSAIAKVYGISATDIIRAIENKYYRSLQYYAGAAVRPVSFLNPRWSPDPVQVINDFFLKTASLLATPLNVVLSHDELDESKQNELDRLKDMQYILTSNNVLLLCQRKGKNAPKKEDLICFLNDTKITYSAIDCITWINDLIDFIEDVSLQGIEYDEIKKLKFILSKKYEVNDVISIMKHEDKWFVNQKKYKNAIRIGHGNTSYRYCAWIVDEQNRKQWNEIFDSSKSTTKPMKKVKQVETQEHTTQNESQRNDTDLNHNDNTQKQEQDDDDEESVCNGVLNSGLCLSKYGFIESTKKQQQDEDESVCHGLTVNGLLNSDLCLSNYGYTESTQKQQHEEDESGCNGRLNSGLMSDGNNTNNDRELSNYLQCITNELITKEDYQAFVESPTKDMDESQRKNYSQIIRSPMCLLDIEKKVIDKQYKNIIEYYDDVRAIATNCQNYNEKGSSIDLLAEKFITECNKLLMPKVCLHYANHSI